LTEVSLKVLPDVEAQATLSFAVADLAQAVALMSAALGSPFEVTGATHDPEAGVTRLRIEGFAGSVDYRAGELERYLGQFGSAEVDRDRDSVRATWAAIRDVSDLAGREGDVWRLSVKPGDAPALVARMAAETVRLDWGGGLIWALVPEGTDLRARLGPFAGHATLVRASAATRAAIPVFQPEAPPVAALAAGLRAKFDPRGILNPGLMG
jgi:glycolate oxidase FAD binding subunit